MKKIVLLVYCLFALKVFAQQKFDVFNYSEPKGYKKEIKTGSITYTKADEKAGTFCVISLYAQSPSSGDLLKDFDNDWAQLIATPFSVTAAPQKDNGDEITGWKTYSGAANFEFAGATSMALLTTAKKDDANVAIIVITNSQSFLTTDVDAFFATIKLGKPLQAAVASNTNTQSNSGSLAKPISIIGEWLYDDGLISILYDYSGHANNDTYNNEVKMTVKNKITIKADGTYEDYTFYNKGAFKKKEITAKGKYKLNGNGISFTPTYHQYIKNDVVQPKDDARNLKTNNATYDFVFDERANAWGVKFTPSDANSYFPDKIYLNASAYKKTGTTNKSVTNNTTASNTSANTSSNKLFNNSGIVGVWINYLNLSPGVSNSSMTWNWRIFFANGKCMTNMPNGGFANLNSGEYFDNTRNNATYFSTGSYSFANSDGEMNASANTKFIDKLQLQKNNQLKIGSTTFTKSVPVNGLKLNGSFTTYADANDASLLEQPIGNRAVITFTSAGRFVDEGVFNTYLFDGATNPEAGKPGSGTYELKDYSIIFKYDDGRVRQEAFSVPLSYTLADAKIILISRARINKIK